MDDSGKKSPTKVDATTGAVSPSKSAKNGKREAEVELEKQVSAKKERRDWVVENQEKEAKVQVKESSSDDSSSDSEEDEKPVAKAAVASKKPPAKNGTLCISAQKVKQAGSSCSSGSTDSDSCLNDDLKTSTLHKKLPAAGKKEPAMKVESSKASGSDSDGRIDDDNTHVTPSSKKLPACAVAQEEKIENCDSLYDESSESFDKDNVSKASKEDIEEQPYRTPQKDVKDEEIVDAGSMEATRKEVPITEAISKEQNASSKTIFVGNLSYRVERADLENLFKDCGEIVKVRFATDRDGRFKGYGHVEFATEEAAQNALELNGNELLRRIVRIEIAREKGAYTPNSSNRNKLLKSFHTSIGEDEPKMPAAPKEQNATSKTLFVGNLSYSVERTDLENLFKDCGGIFDIRFATDREGRFKGFGHVEFATEEAAQNALKLNGTELLRRSVRLDMAPERGALSCNSKNDSFQKGGSGQPQTLFINGFDTSLGEEEPKMPAAPKEQNTTSKTLFVGNLSYSVERADLENLFKDCGEILDIRFATDREGRFKGFGHVEFATEEAAQNALMLNGSELLRHCIRLDLARERNRNDSFQKGGSGESQTVFVRGFDTSLGEDEIRTGLEEHFSSCGMILRTSVAKDYGTGAAKGYAWLDFMDVDGFKKALELDGTRIGGYILSVEERRPRRYNQGDRGGSDQFGGWHGDGWHGGRQWDQGRGYGSRWH